MWRCLVQISLRGLGNFASAVNDLSQEQSQAFGNLTRTNLAGSMFQMKQTRICQMEEGVRAALLSFMKARYCIVLSLWREWHGLSFPFCPDQEARLEPARCDEPVHTVASSALMMQKVFVCVQTAINNAR